MFHGQIIYMAMFRLFVRIYTWSDSNSIELLEVQCTKQNTVKYILKLIDLLFIDK